MMRVSRVIAVIVSFDGKYGAHFWTVLTQRTPKRPGIAPKP